MVVRPTQPLKTDDPSVLIAGSFVDPGVKKLTFVRLPHDANAELPIAVTDSGIRI
jgi:hypothetical protein